MHKFFFFENAYINEIFENAYIMYKIPEKCIRDFVNAYIDIYKPILFLWKYLHENLFFIFFWIFHFFLIVMHEWMLEIIIFNFLMICMNVCSTLYFLFFFNDNLCSNVLFFLKKVCINFQKRMYIQRCYFFS